MLTARVSCRLMVRREDDDPVPGDIGDGMPDESPVLRCGDVGLCTGIIAVRRAFLYRHPCWHTP